MEMRKTCSGGQRNLRLYYPVFYFTTLDIVAYNSLLRTKMSATVLSFSVFLCVFSSALVTQEYHQELVVCYFQEPKNHK